MDVRLYIILLVLTQRKWTHSIAICGSVSEDVNSIYEKFPLPSSMRAIIEVDVLLVLQKSKQLVLPNIGNLYHQRSY